MWNPDPGQPPDHLLQAIQEPRAILQTSSVVLSQEGGAALDAEQDPELWNQARKATAERTLMTLPMQNPRNTELLAPTSTRAHPRPWQVLEILHSLLLRCCLDLLWRTPLHRPEVRVPRRGTADHPGSTRSSGSMYDSDAGVQDLCHGQTQNERKDGR